MLGFVRVALRDYLKRYLLSTGCLLILPVTVDAGGKKPEGGFHGLIPGCVR